MSKLEIQLETIIKNDNLEELKKFFCNNYRIKTYIDITLRHAIFHPTIDNLDIINYILIPFSKKISNSEINYSLEKSRSFNREELVIYILDNYRNRISSSVINLLFKNSVIMNNLTIIEYIIKNYKNVITDEFIVASLREATINNNIDNFKYIINSFKDQYKISKWDIGNFNSLSVIYDSYKIHKFIQLFKIILEINSKSRIIFKTIILL